MSFVRVVIEKSQWLNLSFGISIAIDEWRLNWIEWMEVFLKKQHIRAHGIRIDIQLTSANRHIGCIHAQIAITKYYHRFDSNFWGWYFIFVHAKISLSFLSHFHNKDKQHNSLR